MAFGKDFYLNRTDTAAVAQSSKYVFCALVSDLSELTFNPKFCSNEVGQTVDSFMATLTACKAPASLGNEIDTLLTKTEFKYYLIQATDGRWIAIKRKKDNKGFSFYDPMGGKNETIASSAALTEVLENSYGVGDLTDVIAVKAE